MMVDALSDKAGKGQMNTKVSYDEFGNSMDELTTRMQNLLVEVYQKNETWKHVTYHLADELAEKLDKTELAPVRAYFKSHLKALEERVRYLTDQLEEPDPAGTRRKLLKDMNCLSCNRHASISGVTNAPILPLIGPILAGHQTGSRRAFDLHNMRAQKNRFDPDACNLNIMEAKVRAARQQKANEMNGNRGSMNDQEVMHLVNRYVGGSHTAVSNAERIASFSRARISNPSVENAGFPPVIEVEEDPEEQLAAYYEDVNEQQYPFMDHMGNMEE